MTTVKSSFLAGAEMMTFLAPPSMCALALVASVKKPVDSTTTSAPTSPHGQVRRVLLGEGAEGPVADGDVLVGVGHVAEAAEDRVVLEQVGERLVVGEVVGADDLDVGGAGRVGGLHGAVEVAADAAEAVDAHADGHCGAPQGQSSFSRRRT
jgi:hypothetical protein